METGRMLVHEILIPKPDLSMQYNFFLTYFNLLSAHEHLNIEAKVIIFTEEMYVCP